MLGVSSRMQQLLKPGSKLPPCSDICEVRCSLSPKDKPFSHLTSQEPTIIYHKDSSICVIVSGHSIHYVVLLLTNLIIKLRGNCSQHSYVTNYMDCMMLSKNLIAK